MSAAPRQMRLNAFLMGVGHHDAAWRLPWSRPRDVLDVGQFQNLARIAERGRLDPVFLDRHRHRAHRTDLDRVHRVSRGR